MYALNMTHHNPQTFDDLSKIACGFYPSTCVRGVYSPLQVKYGLNPWLSNIRIKYDSCKCRWYYNFREKAGQWSFNPLVGIFVRQLGHIVCKGGKPFAFSIGCRYLCSYPVVQISAQLQQPNPFEKSIGTTRGCPTRRHSSKCIRQHRCAFVRLTVHTCT